MGVCEDGTGARGGGEEGTELREAGGKARMGKHKRQGEKSPRSAKRVLVLPEEWVLPSTLDQVVDSAESRRKTKRDKGLADHAFSNPGVKAAVATVPQSPPSSSAGGATNPVTRAAAARGGSSAKKPNPAQSSRSAKQRNRAEDSSSAEGGSSDEDGSSRKEPLYDALVNDKACSTFSDKMRMPTHKKPPAQVPEAPAVEAMPAAEEAPCRDGGSGSVVTACVSHAREGFYVQSKSGKGFYVQSSKKQKASGDQREQERADASKKLASMGFEHNAHTEELLRKQDNNLGTVVEQLRAADLQTKKFL